VHNKALITCGTGRLQWWASSAARQCFQSY